MGSNNSWKVEATRLIVGTIVLGGGMVEWYASFIPQNSQLPFTSIEDEMAVRKIPIEHNRMMTDENNVSCANALITRNNK